jgi:hypothetical protein
MCRLDVFRFFASPNLPTPIVADLPNIDRAELVGEYQHSIELLWQSVLHADPVHTPASFFANPGFPL